MHLSKIVEQAHATAREKGFWEVRENNDLGIATSLMLIADEAHEALAIDRKVDVRPALQHDIPSYSAFGDELADIIIRVCDLAGYLGIDLDRRVQDKMEVNKERPRKHGKRY